MASNVEGGINYAILQCARPHSPRYLGICINEAASFTRLLHRIVANSRSVVHNVSHWAGARQMRPQTAWAMAVSAAYTVLALYLACHSVTFIQCEQPLQSSTLMYLAVCQLKGPTGRASAFSLLNLTSSLHDHHDPSQRRPHHSSLYLGGAY